MRRLARRADARRAEAARRSEAAHGGHARWLVSYADLITLLFAFFATLYAASRVEAHQVKVVAQVRDRVFEGARSGAPARASVVPFDSVGVPSEPEEATPPGTIASVVDAEIARLVAEPALAGRVQVRREARATVLSLAEAGFFDSGSAEVRVDARAGLDAVGAMLARLPVAITIEGHTDDTPIRGGRYGSNWELSTARASRVVEWLGRRHGIGPERLSAAGYGEFKPVQPNDTPEGRARNRRVDVILHDSEPNETRSP